MRDRRETEREINKPVQYNFMNNNNMIMDPNDPDFANQQQMNLGDPNEMNLGDPNGAQPGPVDPNLRPSSGRFGRPLGGAIGLPGSNANFDMVANANQLNMMGYKVDQQVKIKDSGYGENRKLE